MYFAPEYGSADYRSAFSKIKDFLETTQSLVNMIHCHGVEMFKAELETFLASIFLNDDILNDVLFRQVFKKAA